MVNKGSRVICKAWITIHGSLKSKTDFPRRAERREDDGRCLQQTWHLEVEGPILQEMTSFDKIKNIDTCNFIIF